MNNRLLYIALVAAAWVVPTAGFAIAPPPLPDTPFFGWLAVPVVGVAGHCLLKKRREAQRNRKQ